MTLYATWLGALVKPITALRRRGRQPRYAAQLDHAVDDAFERFAVRYARLADSLFDRHFLRRHAAHALAAFAAGDLDRQTAAEEVAAAWGRQFGADWTGGRRCGQADLISAAGVFLGWIAEELKRQK
jgi:hypothetical protein